MYIGLAMIRPILESYLSMAGEALMTFSNFMQKRLASKGFVVVAPDLYTGRLIPQFPIEHDPVVEEEGRYGGQRGEGR